MTLALATCVPKAVGTTGLEPKDPTDPRDERAICSTPTLVKECVVVRHCEATSHRAVAFGLQASANGRYGARILLISKGELRSHIVCNFGGQASLQRGFFDLLIGRENTLSASCPVAYNET